MTLVPKQRRFLFVIATSVLTAVSVSAQRHERVVDTWKPLHYDVTIAFNDQLSEINNARTRIDLEILKPNVSSVDLDFGDMPIDSVNAMGVTTRYERKPELLLVTLPHTVNAGEKVSIVVSYHGRPKDGLIFAIDRDGKPSATGDNWPNRVHQWIPCLDHPSAKATVTFTVTGVKSYAVAANGIGTPTINPGSGNMIWQFNETNPIPPYCMIVAVSGGAFLRAKGPSVTPLFYYVPEVDRAYAEKGFSPAAPALAFFSETIAPYPYEKLALIVGATRFGGMENSSAIVFTSTLFDARPNENISSHFGIPTRIEDVVAHEIAHQWFGDSVTESTWADLWLSEGFATYFAGLFIEKYEGEEAFRDYLQRAAERYFAYEKGRNAPIHDVETPDLMRLLNPNNYEKGAWVLHMLRKRLGDEAFFRGLRLYYKAHHEANASTEDLREALEKSSSENLREFFRRWVYGSGHPVYEVSYIKAYKSLTIALKQTQSGEIFMDPVPIEIISGGEKTRVVVRPQSKLTTTHVRAKGGSISIQVDPDGALLKQVSGQ